MDLNEIKQKETVVERLKAMGPSNISAVHCWFCGKVEAWFRCDCTQARLAQEGKRPRPRWDDERHCIVIDETVIARNEALGFKRLPANKVPLAANAAANNEPPANEEADKPDRRAYMRELMRKRRAAKKAPSP